MSRTQGARDKKEAPPGVINIYRILYNADRPMTIFEIAEEMPSTFATTANMTYKAHRELEKGLHGKDLPEGEHEAWIWWIKEQLKIGGKKQGSSGNYSIIAAAKDGRAANRLGPVEDRDKLIVYRHNPEWAPTIVRWEEKMIPHFEPWTPGYSQADADMITARREYEEKDKEFGRSPTLAQHKQLRALHKRGWPS